MEDIQEEDVIVMDVQLTPALLLPSLGEIFWLISAHTQSVMCHKPSSSARLSLCHPVPSPLFSACPPHAYVCLTLFVFLSRPATRLCLRFASCKSLYLLTRSPRVYTPPRCFLSLCPCSNFYSDVQVRVERLLNTTQVLYHDLALSHLGKLAFSSYHSWCEVHILTMLTWRQNAGWCHAVHFYDTVIWMDSKQRRTLPHSPAGNWRLLFIAFQEAHARPSECLSTSQRLWLHSFSV